MTGVTSQYDTRKRSGTNLARKKMCAASCNDGLNLRIQNIFARHFKLTWSISRAAFMK